MKKERVVCPAIQVNVDFRNGNKIMYSIPYINCTEEWHVWASMEDLKMKSDVDTLIVNEGFATSEREFVTKEEALKITGWGNQLRFRGITGLTVEEFYRY